MSHYSTTYSDVHAKQNFYLGNDFIVPYCCNVVPSSTFSSIRRTKYRQDPTTPFSRSSLGSCVRTTTSHQGGKHVEKATTQQQPTSHFSATKHLSSPWRDQTEHNSSTFQRRFACGQITVASSCPLIFFRYTRLHSQQKQLFLHPDTRTSTSISWKKNGARTEEVVSKAEV